MRVEVDKDKNDALKECRKIQIDIFPENEQDIDTLREVISTKSCETIGHMTFKIMEDRQNKLNEKKSTQFETLLNELQSKAILNFGYNADGTYNWKWCDCKPPCGNKYTDCIWRGLKYYNCDTCKDGLLYAKHIPEGTTFTGTSNYGDSNEE